MKSLSKSPLFTLQYVCVCRDWAQNTCLHHAVRHLTNLCTALQPGDNSLRGAQAHTAHVMLPLVSRLLFARADPTVLNSEGETVGGHLEVFFAMDRGSALRKLLEGFSPY